MAVLASCCGADDDTVASDDQQTTTATTAELPGRLGECQPDPPINCEPSTLLVVDPVGVPGGEVAVSWDSAEDLDFFVSIDIQVTCWNGETWISAWVARDAYKTPTASIPGPEGPGPGPDVGQPPTDAVIPIPEDTPPGVYVAGSPPDRVVFEVREE